MTDRQAYIILNMISGVGTARLAAICARFGSPSNVLELSRKQLETVPGIGPVLAEEIAGWKKNIDYEAEMKLADRGGVKVLTKADDDYPPLLKELSDAPLCLYVRGKLDPQNNLVIGIVGSRRVTNYGKKMAEYLSSSAVYAGWTVVSGLAFGIDAAAHQAAIDAKGKTFAVLGGGLARIFPQEHVPLARKIVEGGGAIISEFPMEFPPNRRSFPMRNRIISGLSKGVIVVEAGVSSGALITAKFAIEQNRLVFAVPGQADNPQAKGCNNLIKQGAKLTETFEDIIEEFEFSPSMRPAKTQNENAEHTNLEETAIKDLTLTEEEHKVISLLETGEKTADSLSLETEMPAGKLLALLMKMEMKKIIVQLPGKRFSLKQ